MQELIELCTRLGVTISACESLTAGLFMAELASVPGASKVLQGGFVTYSNQMKESLVKVPVKLLYNYGAVSAECARAMAYNTRLLTETDYAVSFTGNAGPDALENKPAGLVYCAIAGPMGMVDHTFQFQGLSRNELRAKVVKEMAAILYKIIKEESNG